MNVMTDSVGVPEQNKRFCVRDSAILILDGIVVITAVLAARAFVLASPMQDPTQPHWVFARYRDMGCMLAMVYVVMLWAGGFVASPDRIERAKIPALNLLNSAVLFGMGLLACWYYALRHEGQAYVSKRVLFFSIILIYAITTVIHYSSAFLRDRRDGATGQKEE